MDLHIQRANIRTEIKSIMRMDRTIFSADAFDEQDQWRGLKVFWVMLGQKKIGTISFAHGFDYAEDGSEIEVPENLYIVSTGILPTHQGKGYGLVAKTYELAYARHHGFQRVSTTCRQSNERILKMNQRFGFRKAHLIREYYGDEPGVQLSRAMT